MRKSIKELDIIDSEELHEKVEAEAVEIENNFLRVVNEKRAASLSLGSNNGEPLKVPIFDFEINWKWEWKWEWLFETTIY